MGLNFNILIKYTLTGFLIILSAYFFSIGYLYLNSNKLIDQISKTNIIKSNANLKKKVTERINKLDNVYSNRLDDIKKTKKNQVSKKKEIKIIVKKNDTLVKILKQRFKDNEIINKIIYELGKEYNLNKLKINQEIYFYKNHENIIENIIMPINFSTDINIKISNKQVSLEKEKLQIINELESNKFIINYSVYSDGKKANIPSIILSDAIRLFSFDIDFQRDIQKNDELEILYEVKYNNKRENVSYGNIKYIKLTLQNTDLEYFAFKTEDGYLDYYNQKGKNVKKALLKTPIDGARLSSTYGMRKHPIAGYNKMHRGVDFAAPPGTPVYAGGNGTVEFFGRNGGYGKYVRIRHNNQYKTAYAHLKSYKKGMHIGMRVNQGDVIAYVGSTGKSTGPHLHYEIIYKGKQINPMKMKLPSGKTLTGSELINFKKETKKIYSDFLFNLYE